MSLAAGDRLGPYEIVAPIGAGGMGTVYKGRDTRLDRDVAIKVSAERFSERFEREARTISSLNHPHICTLYDVGQNYLVMELVEGETLRGPLPMDEALAIARQIAEALEAAHEKGVTHRDLKPGNIKIKPDGTVKVLDFGLAKVTAADPADPENSPTLSAGAATAAGVILGTPAYMAPEQARGLTVDKRADIWAFGVVLYELLTGKRMFAGESTTDILAAVVRAEPDWSALPASTPAAIRRLLERCVVKDRKARLPDIGVARLEIDEALSPEGAAAVDAPTPTARRWLPLTLALLAGGLIVSGLWWVSIRSSGEATRPLYFSVALTADTLPTYQSPGHFAISPDGRNLAYVIQRGGKRQLFLRGFGEAEGRAVNGTDDAVNPFFSPDGRWIGFGSGRTLKKVPVSGGTPNPLCEMEGDALQGASWGQDGNIVFVPQFNGGLWTVSESGGSPKLLVNTDETKDRIAYLYPHHLPGGRGVLFSMMSGGAKTADDFRIALLEPGAPEPRILFPGGFNSQHVPATGHIVYISGGALVAVPFDLARLAVTGTPRSVIDEVGMGIWGYANYSLSQNGTLLYEPRESVTSGNLLTLVDRKGEIRPVTDGRAYPDEFSVSPDGKRIVARMIAANDDLWTYDVAHGTPLPLTSEPPDEVFPQWTPDGTRIAFGTRTGKIFWTLADGTGKRELLSAGDYGRYPSSFSPDGKTLAFVETHPSTQRDIWLMATDDPKARPLVNTSADEWGPKFSPDGRWLAYISNETGRDEIYVIPIGAPGARKPLKGGASRSLVWARSWELFFNRDDKIFSIPLDMQANASGPERLVLDSPRLEGFKVDADAARMPFFDVMPDGEHFVVRFIPQYPQLTHYNVVLNFFEELKRQ